MVSFAGYPVGGAVAMFLTVVISGLILQALGVPQTSNLDQYGDKPSALLIVFLFVLASGGLLVKTMMAGASFASVFALATFLALASGVFVGLFRMARQWENEVGH